MNNPTFNAAMTESLHTAAYTHLFQKKGQEDLCFALWRPSTGASRSTAIIHRLVLPAAGERLLHGNASFFPHFFERALSEARAEGTGLAFLHSHVGPGWQDMSKDDIVAELGMAAPAKAITDLPLVGLTLGTDGAWSARYWVKTAPSKYERRWCEVVRVLGERLAMTFYDALRPVPQWREELVRTVSAWGRQAQSRLARLRTGVVGAGSVGAIIAEALARMGIGQITLIDFDIVEPLNRDRLLHAREEDALLRRLKISMLADALHASATAPQFEVRKVPFSITEDEGFRAALDCDVVFCCVDRPWGRCALNLIAYAHLIPVIDGGVLARTGRRGQMVGADVRAHTVGPARRCLVCLGQYDPGLVPVERDGLLDDPSYILGLPADHVSRRNENVFAFSVAAAAFELQQLISLVVAPAGISNVGPQCYHYATGRMDEPIITGCDEHCVFPAETGLGDHSSIKVTGAHPASIRTREMLRM